MGKRLLFILFIFTFFCTGFSQISNPVKWKFDYRFVSENIVELIFKADIDSKFHMYGAYFADGGPIRTTFHFDSTNNFQLQGIIAEKNPPVKKHDSSFDMDITIHSGIAVFTQLVKLKSSSALIKGTVEYMVCTDEKCLPPVDKEFSFKIGAIQKSKKLTTDSSKISVTKEIIDSGGTNMASTDTLSKNKSGILEKHQSSQSQSLWSFFILALIAGFAGVITPCVFPMIPMTVSFFMRGSGTRAHGIMNGIIFGLAIIGIYTAVGALVSFTSVGASFANQLSTHWLPNLIFFLLFLIFAASFLGMFEIVLPGSFVNKADQQADKGGILGIIFMALVTVLVSFSCTGPIVGALLVEAAGGAALKPILGMFGFGLAFALPFAFFAIFPSSLKSLPKSGGWLNSVKVFLGFVMLALSLKFLVNIDQAYHFNLLSRELFLAIWIVITTVLGFYFLGKIRFAHDSALETISVPRLLLGIASFSLALYLFTGFINAPLSAFSSILPSPSENKNSVAANNSSYQSNICQSPKYSDIFHLPYGLKGYFDYKQGMECASNLHKPIFFDFKGHSCSNCKVMESQVWSNPEVQKVLSENFVIIALYADDRTLLPENEWIKSKVDFKFKKTIGQVNADFQIEKFKNNSLPLYAIADENLNLMSEPIGMELEITRFLAFLNKSIEEYKKRNNTN